MERNLPPLRRNPCWTPSWLVSLPTMSPDGVMAVACVLTAPGKSNEMTLPVPKTRALVDELIA